MDRELAESYVQYQIDQTKQDKKIFVLGFFLIVGMGLLICAFSHSEVFYFIALFVCLFCLASVIIYCKKPTISGFFYEVAFFIICLLVACNCLCFFEIRMLPIFSWLNYSIFLAVQIVSFCVTVPLTVHVAKKHNKNKKAINWAALGIGSGLGLSAYALGKIVAEYTTFEQASIISIVLLILASWIGSYMTSRELYCVILIKRYKLNIYNKYNPKPEQVENATEETPSDNCGNPSD